MVGKSVKLHTKDFSFLNDMSDEMAGRYIKSVFDFMCDGFENTNVDTDIQEYYTETVDNIKKEWSKYNPKTKKYHWNYLGGITSENKLIRNSSKYGAWRSLVFKRDNYTCQRCGKKGVVLNAHHIKSFSKYPQLRTKLSNGLTLCEPCHKHIHSKN